MSWDERWEEGRIGFHESAVNADLTAHEEKFLAGGPHRVLVPLCGKTVDLSYLADRGHEVVGVEFVDRAVADFWRERGEEPERESRGPIEVTRKGAITLLRGDIFDVTSELAGPVARIWDRAAMVALGPQVRGPYVEKLRELAAPGCEVLLVTFEYDPDVMDGPPFPVASSEVESAYSGARIQRLASEDRIEELPRWREVGHGYWLTHVDHITLP